MDGSTHRYAWARWGDVNAFFGLILDNVAVMIVLVVLVTGADPVAQRCFSREFVLTQMIPGTALGVVLGDLAYTWMAFRLARRSGRSDVTAMPLGLDTPSTFAVGPLVLVPALGEGMARYGLDHQQAMVFGWHVGAMVLVMIGLMKSLVSPLGGKIRKAVPRAGLLGSLAAIALALIAFVPLWTHIAAVPICGAGVADRHPRCAGGPSHVAAASAGRAGGGAGRAWRSVGRRGTGPLAQLDHRTDAGPPGQRRVAGAALAAGVHLERCVVGARGVACAGQPADHVALRAGDVGRRDRLHRERRGRRR